MTAHRAADRRPRHEASIGLNEASTLQEMFHHLHRCPLLQLSQDRLRAEVVRSPATAGGPDQFHFTKKLNHAQVILMIIIRVATTEEALGMLAIMSEHPNVLQRPLASMTKVLLPEASAFGLGLLMIIRTTMGDIVIPS